jgi:hypothetical protein
MGKRLRPDPAGGRVRGSASIAAPNGLDEEPAVVRQVVGKARACGSCALDRSEVSDVAVVAA